MAKLFIVSSLGDTDLAKETIQRLLLKSEEHVHILALTEKAYERVATFSVNPLITLTRLNGILHTEQQPSQLDSAHLGTINRYITTHQIDMAYVGVPSEISEERPFVISAALQIPFVIAYEYMFKPNEHAFWRHVSKLSDLEQCTFVAPLAEAVSDILHVAPKANVKPIGHLSIDRALESPLFSSVETREQLGVSLDQKLVLVSGTTQPHQVDLDFLEALLQELATGKHPLIQVRFGIHPGTRNMQEYLDAILILCDKYPSLNQQVKIILPYVIKEQLTDTSLVDSSSFILEAEVSGPKVANAADNIAQAVPGALLNEAALIGKPSYYHNKDTKPYLPRKLFANSIAAFFSAQPGKKCTREELALSENTAPQNLATMMLAK